MEAQKIAYNPYTDKAFNLLEIPCTDGNYTRQCYSLDDIRKIIIAFSSDVFVKPSSRYQHSYYTGFIKFRSLTGCRIEEAIALTWDDIKLSGGNRYIVFSKAFKGETQNSDKIVR